MSNYVSGLSELQQNSSNASKPETSKKSRAVTFEEFRKAKAASRVTTLPSSSRGTKAKSPGKVKIQIGIKQYEKDVSLKALKGRTLPLTVDANIDAHQLLQEAVTKHSKHFRTFSREKKYHLLYPDNTIVRHLRSSHNMFTLQKYKEELGKPFSRIYLYLCADECLGRAEMHELGLSSDDDEMEAALSTPAFGNPTSTLADTLCFNPTLPSSSTDTTCVGPVFPPPPSVVLGPTAPRPSHTQAIGSVTVVEDHDLNKDGHHPPVPKKKKSTQPSILPFLADDDHNHSSQIACPVCFKSFNRNEIARHADECAERFDPIGIVHVSDSESEDGGNVEDNDLDVSEKKSVDPSVEQIKELISSKLCPNIDKGHTNKVNIRRMYAFEDYVEKRKKPKQSRPFMENAILKVAFYGEPAVDDGGPRREFFTGKLNTCNSVYCICVCACICV